MDKSKITVHNTGKHHIKAHIPGSNDESLPDNVAIKSYPNDTIEAKNVDYYDPDDGFGASLSNIFN
jgi:hypothetical protein